MDNIEQTRHEVTLIAEGDSWFEYLSRDLLNRAENVYADDLTDIVERLSQIPNSGILAELSNFGYKIESVAHRGDTLASMANDEKQYTELGEAIQKASDKHFPVAVILSAGGNDLIEKISLPVEGSVSSKAILLDSLLREDGGGLDQSSVDLRLSDFSGKFRTLITRIKNECSARFDEPVPIFIHGYDFPVPDGRGYSPLAFPFAGPWLQPAFERMGYYNLEYNTAIMKELVEKFNEMVLGIVSSPEFGHVYHVDLRGWLSNRLRKIEYQWYWDNEMHPSKKGFEIISLRFDAEIQAVFNKKGIAVPST